MFHNNKQTAVSILVDNFFTQHRNGVPQLDVISIYDGQRKADVYKYWGGR